MFFALIIVSFFPLHASRAMQLFDNTDRSIKMGGYHSCREPYLCLSVWECGAKSYIELS